MDKIIALLVKNFSPILDELWTSISFWRASTLILLLACLLAWTFRERILKRLNQSEKREHDRKIFVQTDSILSERQLRDFIGNIEADHSYFLNGRLQFRKWSAFFEEVGNRYQISKIDNHREKLFVSINQLLNFLAFNFFVYPDTQRDDNVKYCMYPELNMDREGSATDDERKKYSQYTLQLNKHTKIVLKNYINYRKLIKKELNL